MLLIMYIPAHIPSVNDYAYHHRDSDCYDDTTNNKTCYETTHDNGRRRNCTESMKGKGLGAIVTASAILFVKIGDKYVC